MGRGHVSSAVRSKAGLPKKGYITNARLKRKGLARGKTGVKALKGKSTKKQAGPKTKKKATKRK